MPQHFFPNPDRDLANQVDDLRRRVMDLERQVITSKGGWVNFTPSLVWSSSGTQPSLGNGVKEAQYRLLGDVCIYEGALFFGSTTTPGTGQYSVNLPFPAHISSVAGASTPWTGSAKYYSGTNDYPAVMQIFGGSAVYFPISSDGVAQPAPWSAGWGGAPNNGNFDWTILYRIA